MHQRLSALSPKLPLVRRESGCTGVHRSDSLDTLMQEEPAHFRVDANGGESGAPFCLFEFESVWGVVDVDDERKRSKDAGLQLTDIKDYMLPGSLFVRVRTRCS